MKKTIFLLFIVSALILSSCSKKTETPKPQINNAQPQNQLQEAIRVKAPEFELTSLNGKKVKLSDYRGKIVVLNFFATWCPPCKAEMPGFVSTMEEYSKKDKDVVFLFIDLDEENSVVAKFLKERNYTTVDPLMDKGGAVFGQYTLRGGIPTTAIIDRNGNVAIPHEGLMDPGTLKTSIEEVRSRK